MQKSSNLKKHYCLICNNKQKTKIITNKIKDDIKCRVHSCQNCGFVFLDKEFVNKELHKKFYKSNYTHTYDEKFFTNKNNIYKKIFDLIKPYVKDKNILEIGSGGGYMYYYLKKILNSYEALEIGDELRKNFKKKNSVRVYESLNKIKKKYDVVILISVLEHVKDVNTFLSKIKKHIKKNGKIIIEVPSVNDPLVSTYKLKYYKTNYFRKVHLHYFNKDTLNKILKRSGLKVIKNFTKLTYSFTNHLNWLYMKKGQKNSRNATNISLPIKIDNKMKNLFLLIDNLYKKELEKRNIGDIELVVCETQK